jgi:hypothetical protein
VDRYIERQHNSAATQLQPRTLLEGPMIKHHDKQGFEESWTLGKHPRHASVGFSSPIHVHVRFLLALLIDLHA